MDNRKIELIESIVTYQGEGVDRGKRVLLLRFKYCDRVENKNPCPFCDTIFKMVTIKEEAYNVNDLQNIIHEEKCGLLITGGCPTFGKHFDDTLFILNNFYFPFVNVESNGYKLPELIRNVNNQTYIKYIYSPKIFNKDDLDIEKERTEKLMKYNNVYVKLVVEKNDLIIKYLDFLNTFSISSRIFLMPEGDTQEKLLKNLPKTIELSNKYKTGFSGRDHIIYNFV